MAETESSLRLPVPGIDQSCDSLSIGVVGKRDALNKYIERLLDQRQIGTHAGVYISSPDGYPKQHYIDISTEKLPLGTYLLDYSGIDCEDVCTDNFAKRLYIDEGNITDLGVETLDVLDTVDHKMPTYVTFDSLSKLFKTEASEGDIVSLLMALSRRVVVQQSALIMTLNTETTPEELPTVKSLVDYIVEVEVIDGDLEMSVTSIQDESPNRLNFL